jgi:hypothetical protein
MGCRVPMDEAADFVEIVSLLAAPEGEGDPTIASILAAVPGLREMSWINRRSCREWRAIATALPTPAVERLFKILVIAEREFEWDGGSVAAPIWLFHAYWGRYDAEPNRLAAWALRNRGRNVYIPYGSPTPGYRRPLDEWRPPSGWRIER